MKIAKVNLPLIQFVTTLILLTNSVFAQNNSKVLHYTETSGFDHQTRSNSLALFQSFSNLSVTDDPSGSGFDTLSNLIQYDLVIFSNTSGDQLLDSTQRSHFEQYIQQGGNVLGIHAATDTYRHSTANGNKTGTWDFYPETIGGSVQENPNHVAGTPAYNMTSLGNHPTISGLPNPWNKNEEYYYWENGYLDSNIQVVLKVEQTVGPNNQINSYDSARAVSWIKELSTGSRIFYTSAGHLNSSFTADTLFKKHIENAVNWCTGLITSYNQNVPNTSSFKCYPNPTYSILQIEMENKSAQNGYIKLYSVDGKLLFDQKILKPSFQINMSEFNNGIYMLEAISNNQRSYQKVIKQ